MKVSAKELYGLRAIAELAVQYGHGPVSLSDVARAQDISLDYLEQVVPSLRMAGLVVSTRGARGGYELGRPPSEITVGDVLRALGGDILPIQCVHQEELRPCERSESCVARAVWQTVYARVQETLDGITLADL